MPPSAARVLTMSDKLQVNAVVWLRSLPEDEQGPSRRMIEDLEDLAKADEKVFILRDIPDTGALAKALHEIAEMSAQGLRPIIVVDAHGSQENGVLLAPGGEWADWATVIDAIREVNVATGNNLICLFSLCYGMHLYKLASLSKAVPAYLSYAPVQEVKVGDLEDNTVAFFRAVLTDGDMTLAFERHLSTFMEQQHCQGLFIKALANYVRTFCMGKGKRKREEAALTRLLEHRGLVEPTLEELRAARAEVKQKLKPGQHIIAHYAPRFLLGRPALFTYADVKTLASARRR